MNMKNNKVLISGASIAGPTLAYWLQKFGYQVTVVERHKELRLGGQNIDIKGAAKEVAEKMGIYDEIKQSNTGEVGTHYVDKDNNITASFEQGEKGGLTSELEILRGDLVQILYNHTKDGVEYRFGDYVTHIDDQGEKVAVTFNSGKTETYDLVVGADGQRSKSREMVFNGEANLRYLGLYTSYLTIPKGPTDSNWARWYIASKSRNILVRPDNKGGTRVAFNFLTPDNNYGRLPIEEQKQLLQQVFADAGWETERLLEGMQKSDDLYLDSITQVRMPRWSKGRVVLVGDAAYCPTPLTGKGTALAMIGAYILANELNINDTHEAAFQAYDKKFRSYVESTQSLPTSFVKLVYPSSELGVYLLNKLEGLIASKVFQTVAGLFSSEKSDEDDFKLPVYQDQASYSKSEELLATESH
jgi:2-polyprenyl-6-methoxyphenol hydroxylase-like FAD-dependent oxidoreductase